MSAIPQSRVDREIYQLQQDLVHERGTVTALLRRALLLARKKNDEECEHWIREELDGYTGPASQMPDYRTVHGDPRALNPYRGWIPMRFEDPLETNLISTRRCGQPVPEIEKMVGGGSESNKRFHMPIPAEMEAELNRNSTFGMPTQFTLFVSPASLHKILAAVRSRLLDWTMRFCAGAEEVETKEKAMSLKSMMTDALCVLRDGEVLCKIKGRVDPLDSTVTTFETNTPILEGDVYAHALPNGAEERFEVIESGFQSGHGGIPDSYVSTVQKVTSRQRPTPAPSSITYNVHGPNARINNNSIDQSTNTVSSVGIWTELQAAIEKVPQPEREQLAKAAAAMKEAHGKPTFIDRYKDFMATASNHVTVLGPIVAKLATLF